MLTAIGGWAEKIKQCPEIIKKMNKYTLGLGIVAIVAISFCFFNMSYIDNPANSRAGYFIINGLFSGSFSEVFNNFDWSYGMSIYFIYAIWSIPIWMINKAVGETLTFNEIGVLLWYKLLLVVFAIWSIYLIGKIVKKIRPKMYAELILVYTTSLLFVIPIFAIAQCDIMGICFVLLGMYYYIANDNKKFILFFAIACTMKYFAIFAFIPLVLLRFKSLDKLLGVLMAGLLLVLISSFIIGGSDASNVAFQNEEYYINQHIYAFSEIALKFTYKKNIGFFGIFFAVVCVIAYLMDESQYERPEKCAFWVAFAGYASLFMGYYCHIYWYVILVPMMILMFLTNPHNRKINYLLETFWGLMIVLEYCVTEWWVVFGLHTYESLFFRDKGVAARANFIEDFFTYTLNVQLIQFVPLITGISYGIMIMLLIINYPSSVGRRRISVPATQSEIKMIITFRTVLLYSLLIISLVEMFKEYDRNVFDDDSKATVSYSFGTTNTELCEAEGIVMIDSNDSVWMQDSYNISFMLNYEFENDMRLTVEGLSIEEGNPLNVYVNGEFVGKMSESRGDGVRDKYLTIPNRFFDHEKLDQQIELKAEPVMETTKDEITYNISYMLKEITLEPKK